MADDPDFTAFQQAVQTYADKARSTLTSARAFTVMKTTELAAAASAEADASGKVLIVDGVIDAMKVVQAVPKIEQEAEAVIAKVESDPRARLVAIAAGAILVLTLGYVGGHLVFGWPL